MYGKVLESIIFYAAVQYAHNGVRIHSINSYSWLAGMFPFTFLDLVDYQDTFQSIAIL
jgi:hypothetical protein